MGEEMWVGIDGWPYEVSDMGSVRNARTGYVLSPAVTSGGYTKVTLREGSRVRQADIHTLVAVGFLGAYPDGMEVNHKNGNKPDNRSANLEYVTPKQNIAHAYETGLRKGWPGVTNPSAKLNDNLVRRIHERLMDGYTTSSIATDYGVSRACIWKIQTGRSWPWIYAEFHKPQESDDGDS